MCFDFDRIEVRDVKYLSFFYSDILFVLPPVPFGVPSAYGHSMDRMDKMYNGHPWYNTKITSIINDFALTFRLILVQVISNALMNFELYALQCGQVQQY